MAIDNSNATQEAKVPTSIIGFFDTEKDSEAAYKVLEDLGYPPVSVTMAIAEQTYQEKYVSPNNPDQDPHADAQGGPISGKDSDDIPKTTKAMEGFALGTTAGATIGALALLGASVVVPGVAILGPLAATLTGAGAGATVGGLTGFLFGSAHPEKEDNRYQELITNGKFMIRVSPKSANDAATIERKWKTLGGEVELLH